MEQTGPFYFLNNLVKSRSISIIFGTQIPEWICNKMMTKLSTSPNECHYTTLWNTACVNLFITTVMQALNVMANWQLWANTSQQMFSVLAFGFDTCIKMISPLIKCLINDALFWSSKSYLTTPRWRGLGNGLTPVSHHITTRLRKVDENVDTAKFRKLCSASPHLGFWVPCWCGVCGLQPGGRPCWSPGWCAG